MTGGLPGRSFRWLWSLIPRAARRRMLPYVLETHDEVDKLRLGFPTMEGLLRTMHANGFQPGGIIDIGANVGEWSRMARSVFPRVPVILVDGNPDMAAPMRATVERLGSDAGAISALLGPDVRSDVPFHVVGTGSSVLPELTTFGREVQHLPMTTLDRVVEGTTQASVRAPLLMKLDVQGFELEVLRGGTRTLGMAEVVILETSVLPYNEGAPTFEDVVAFMHTAGFSVSDFCGQFRRETDHALYQTDVAFVRTDSALRAPKKFWLTEP
jgi:FkbM family methyltransferase